MKKVLGSLIALALILVPMNAVAAVRAGDLCKKAGKTATANGKKYTCIKSGKKLVWNKGVTVAAPKPLPVPTPTSPIPEQISLEEANRLRISLDPLSGKSCSKDGERIPNFQGFLICMSQNSTPLTWHQSFTSAPAPIPQTPTSYPIEVKEKDNYVEKIIELSSCQLKETRNFSGAGSKGFPIRNYLPSTGKVKIAIIPVDFASAPGQFNPGISFADDVQEISRWGEYFSRGKLQYEVNLVSNEWLRAPKDADWYVCMQCQKGGKSEKQSQTAALQELINVSDPFYDFTGVQFIYFVFPEEAESKFGTSMFGRNMQITTLEGNQTVSIYGEMGGSVVKADRTKIWDHLIHEILHYQGFIGHGPINGAELGIMQQQWGASKAVTSWEAFMAGWFGPKEIVCIDKTSITENIFVTMSSIDNFGGNPVSLMIKLSSEELLIIEKRENGIYSDFTKSPNYPNLNNFTAYYINVNLESYRNDGDPDSESKNFWRYLRENQKIALNKGVTFEGLTLTPISSNQIRISKSS